MNLFYFKDISPNGYCTLDAEESRHAVRVLRMREGDELHVTDGCGHLYHCRVVDANERACLVNPEECVEQELQQTRLHLAVAPTKNPARMEWLVEKAVEMGVDEITLLQCDHSERSFLKTDRLQKLAISAMKQSLHTILPTINSVVNLHDMLMAATWSADNQRFIAHCEVDKPRTLLRQVLQADIDTVVLIGPEGDFSEDEIALALEKGFQPVSFGTARLRTETAALYAVAAFNYVNSIVR